MKKLNLKNLKLSSSDLLQREQLKSVFGGYIPPSRGGGNYGSCTVTLDCYSGTVSCTSQTGDCKRGWGDITCDGITYTC